ncbi:hypothetical protein [Primorskyibacter sp. S87]|uniref:hypothetical protein n=1 Tax=Primorskyibacter sp. S87 TaxID=3415126 RepID=UPI003C7C1261
MSWLSTLTGVLFVGHSLFGQTNPDMLDAVLPETVRVEAQIINGAPLKWNWENGADAEGTNARAVLPQGGINAVILTEAVPLAGNFEWNDTVTYATRFYELAVSSDPQTRVFLQETWHSLKSGTGVEVEFDPGGDVPWRDRLDQDLPVWQSIVDAVNSSASGPEMELLPAGQAMARLHDEIAAGTVPGLKDIRDVFQDDIHPNDFGFYYLTMLQYAVLTGEHPRGLPRRLKSRWGQQFRPLTPVLAARLQDLAWDVAQNIPDTRPTTETPSVLENSATAAVTTTPLPDDLPIPVADLSRYPPPATPPPLATNLAGILDFSTQQPFLDIFKTARPWVGHLRGEWGGVDHHELQSAGFLDPNGWPLAIPHRLGSIGTVILTDIPKEATHTKGRYRLTYDGYGIIEVSGRAENVRYGKGEIQFDYTPGPGLVEIRIQRTDRGAGGDHVRNISVVKFEHAAAFDAGAIFNPLWLDQLEGFELFRFMDWMDTNDSTQSSWDNRPMPQDFSYALKGVPLEIMLELLNRTGVDGWFCMPHLADDDFLRNFAEMVKRDLWVDQRTYVEFSNEVWNWQFQQAVWADETALSKWQAKDSWVQAYAARSVEMARIWTEVFADAPERLIRVISTQTGWTGLEQEILEPPLLPNLNLTEHFDAYAITGYFGVLLGMEDRAPLVRDWLSSSKAIAEEQARSLPAADQTAYVAAHKYDAALRWAWAELRDGSISGQPGDTLEDLLTRILPYHADVATRHGLDLIMYEGGSHVVGLGNMLDDDDLTDFLSVLNYSEEMGLLYKELIAGWYARGGQLFTAFTDVFPPSKWGSWGHLRHLNDTNPRWKALEAWK